jgi:hypothetical protein
MHRSIAQRFRARLYALLQPPDNDSGALTYEQRALRLMQREGALDVATLIDRVADEAMHAAKIDGAAALDIAVWGPSVFQMEAAAAIRGMIGRTLVLECDGPWMLLVPATYEIATVAPRRSVGIAPLMA